MHDCWAFTGHCSYFDHVHCEKWKQECHSCPIKHAYPASWFLDRSRRNYRRKKALFTSLTQLTVVTPSNWLAELMKSSFFKQQEIKVINNGIDLDAFHPAAGTGTLQEKYRLQGKTVILGVASIWSERKGLNDFLAFHKSLRADEKLILVGLSKKQIKMLPPDILGLERTESVAELASFYALARVYLNPTYLDNFPTTNLEALACGTPVITYRTGGSPEAVDQKTGIVLPKGHVEGIRDAIDQVLQTKPDVLRDLCRERASSYFSKTDRFRDYIALYQELTGI
jgi:glycosyltransferase involved in cell wall biosynthesis